jgi:hypothetical protein
MQNQELRQWEQWAWVGGDRDGEGKLSHASFLLRTILLCYNREKAHVFPYIQGCDQWNSSSRIGDKQISIMRPLE